MRLKKMFFISIVSMVMTSGCVGYDEILDTFMYTPATEAVDYMKYLEKEKPASIKTVHNQDSRK